MRHSARTICVLIASSCLASCATGPSPDYDAPPSVQYKDCWDGGSVPITSQCPPAMVEDVSVDDDPITQCKDESAISGSEFACVPVLFGTNRELLISEEELNTAAAGETYGHIFGVRPDPACEPSQMLSDSGPTISELKDRETVCHTGLAVITIPDAKKRLEDNILELNPYTTAGKRPQPRHRQKQFTIWDIGKLNEQEFRDATQEMLDAFDPGKNHAIVYVHGFNVPFEGALYRTAQIKYDMEFQGPVFSYSWPSNAKGQHYLLDQDDADLSIDSLVRFLHLVQKSVNEDTQVHLIVHSLGTRITTQALAIMAADNAGEKTRPFTNVVFAGADLDRSLFSEWLEQTGSLTPRVTIYANSDDKALKCSSFIRKFFSKNSIDPKARVGLNHKTLGRAIFNDSKIRDHTTIDMSALASKSLFSFICTNRNHATYVQEPEAFHDLSCVLNGYSPESKERRRFLSGPHEDEFSGRKYWRLIKGDGSSASGADLDLRDAIRRGLGDGANNLCKPW